MAFTKTVDHSVQPTFLGSTFPPAGNDGETFVNEATFPKSLYVWWHGEWRFYGYLREVSTLGTACYLTSVASALQVDRTLSFVTEACSVVAISSPFTQTAAGSADTLDNGYMFGGFPGAFSISNIAKLAFSNQVVSPVVSTLTVARGYLTAVHDYSAARAAGGATQMTLSNPVQTHSTIDKFMFSSEACGLLTSTLRIYKCAMSQVQSPTDGFFAGGTYGASPGVQVTLTHIDRLSFSTDATSYLATTLTHPAGDGPCGVSAPMYGYSAGGTIGGGLATTKIDRLSFLSYTVAALVSGLSVARGLTSGGMNSVNGYIFGGYNGSGPTSYSVIDRLMFSTETDGVLTSNLGVTSANLAQGMNDMRYSG